MSVFTGIWTIFAGNVQNAADEINRLYVRLVTILLIFAGLACLQWGINAFLNIPAFNYVFFFVGGGLLLLMLLTPIRGMGIGAGLGTIYAALSDTDISQSALKGILWWIKGVIIVVFAWWLLSGFLSTWPLKENPWAFWPVAAGACVVAITSVVYGWKSRIFPIGVVAYALIVIAIALLSTIPNGAVETWWGTSQSEQQAQKAATEHKAQRVVMAPEYLRVIAPVGSESESIEIHPTRCLILSGEGNSPKEARFLWQTSWQGRWGPLTEATATAKLPRNAERIRFASNTTRQEMVLVTVLPCDNPDVVGLRAK